MNNNYFNQNTSLSLNLIFWKGFVFQNKLNHQYYQGLSEGYDQNYLLWNISLGKKLFKDDRGEIRITVFDLLNQNTNVHRIVTDAYLEDIRTNVLNQYIMATFIYQIRNFGE